MPEPRTTPAKANMPDLLSSPDLMATVAPILPDVLRAAAKHYREQGQDEIRRPQLVTLRRYFAQSLAYVGKPADVTDEFGKIEGLD